MVELLTYIHSKDYSFPVLEAITYLTVCNLLFLLGIPIIYMAMKNYLQQLLCCSSHQSDYENINGDSFSSDLSDSFDTFDDIFNPPPETPPKEPSTFTFESKGYYYSRQAQLGSKFVLLGMMPDDEATKGKITTDVSYSFLQEKKPGIQINISNLTFLDQHDHTTTDKSMYKFKIKIVNHDSINPDEPLNTVCHLESDFIPYNDIQKHIFKIYSYDATEIFENLELKLRVYYKRTLNSERFYLGDGKLKLVHKDVNGNVVKEKMTLRKDWKRQISA
eukprot:TCONS_00009551-protein